MFSLKKLPQRTQLMLLVLVTAGCCYAFYSSYLGPVRADVEGLRQKARLLEVQVAAGRKVQAQLPEFKAEVESQRQKLMVLSQILPDQKETAEIVRQIQELATKSRLRIKSFTPQKTVRKDFYEDWPILMSIDGNYDNLGVFFERVGQFTRLVNVDNISIKAQDKKVSENQTIAATCTATTFVFVEPEDTGLEMTGKDSPFKSASAQTLVSRRVAE